MAIIPVSTASALNSAMATSAGGDIIEVAAGTYGSIIRNTATTKSTPVTIRPANRANPPRFIGNATAPGQGTNDKFAFFLRSHNGFVFDGLHIQGPTVSTGTNYPLMTESGIYMLSCKNITIRDCSFFDNMRQIYFNGPGNDNYLIERNFFTRCGMDSINCYGDGSNITIQNNDFRPHRPDPARVTEGPRHPDAIQFNCIDTYTGHDDVTIQDNRIETWQGYEQQIFCNNLRINQTGTPTNAEFNSFGFNNLNIRRNLIIGFHQHGILTNGQNGGSITGNKIVKLVPGATNNINIPTISSEPASRMRNVTVTNNVTPRAFESTGWSGSTFSGNIVSTTASPVGWSNPIVGPYSNVSEPTTPTQLTNAATQARISGTFNAGVHSGVQYYGGRLVVPTTCPSYQSDPGLTTYQWEDGNPTDPNPDVNLTISGSKTITSPGSNTSLEDYLVTGGNIPWSTRIQVLLPPNYDANLAGGYGVLYALPGLSASYDVFTNDMSNLRTALTTKPMIVVTFDADITNDGSQANGCQGWYIDSPIRPDSAWLSFFWDDLVPFIDTEYNTGGAPKRGLTGFSMGAYGAWWLMCHKPSEIAVIDTMSGAYLVYADPSGSSTLMNNVLGTRAANLQNWEDHSMRAKIDALVAAGTTFPPRRIRVGNTGDVLNQSTNFSNFLTNSGLTHQHIVTAGDHNFAYWHAQIGAITTFVNNIFTAA